MFGTMEQFEILMLTDYILDFTSLVLTNELIMVILVGCVIILVGALISIDNSLIVLNGFSFIFYIVANFLFVLLSENISSNRTLINKFFILFFFLFFFIIICNFLGMVPYTFTLTSQIILTMWLASSAFFCALYLGFWYHGVSFSKLLIPSGVPSQGVPFLILIEFISYFARLFSLGIRLFANLMAGHALMKILAGFCWNIILNSFYKLPIFLPVGFILFCVILIVTCLEFAVAFLQAYVFVVLTSIYVNESVYMH